MIARSWPLIMCVFAYGMCGAARARAAENTAFFYGPNVPRELLAVYDQVVVEPSNIPDVAALSGSRAALVAYISIGEVSEADTRPIAAAWVLGRNAAWSSRVMDLTHPGYRSFLRERFEALWRAGYRRFFLDTLDSYVLAAPTPQLQAAQRSALAQLIRELAQARPDARFVLNRGFELLPEVASLVHGVVAESLFDRFDAASGTYVRVPDADRAWLIGQLRAARDRYKLPVIVIDYRPPAERAQARETAQRITALGFMPWVCSGSVADVGVGALEIMPRRVLIVSEDPETQPGPVRWLAPVLEYLGYVPEYATPAALPVASPPTAALRGRYAGIITLLRTADAGEAYQTWLLEQLQAGLRVVIFGELGFSPDGHVAQQLGIRALEQPQPGELVAEPTVFSARDHLIGFEAEPQLQALEGVPLALRDASARHLEVRLASGEIATAIATTRWGGLARSHVFATRGLHGERAWVLDPFTFLSQALGLPQMPVPDLTTESGGRVAMFAIDVEGAGQNARMRGRPLVSDALLELLAGQPWPHALGAQGKPDAADYAALQKLLAAASAYPDGIRMGSTSAHGALASLTQLAPLYAAGEVDPIAAPIAADSSYLEGSNESYAFERVLATFAFTDTPRRLRPIALHYHAYAASSPGGVNALSTIYGALAQLPLFVLRVADYRQRVQAFRTQAIARDLWGAYAVFGGEALRTLRVPIELGSVDAAQSSGVAALTTLRQGRYLTFAAQGERRVGFQPSAHEGPYLERANGRIDRFVVSSSRGAVQIMLDATALEPLVLRFAGFAPASTCSFTLADQTLRATSDRTGRLMFTLPKLTTGASTLTCHAP